MKYINTIIAMCISVFLFGCGNTTKAPAAALDYVGAGYEEVIEGLQQAGFVNIETEIIEDLSSTGVMKDGTVEMVVIDDCADYEKGKVFSCDVKVVVTCHRIRKIAAPISSKDVQNSDYEKVGELFADAGFSNVEVNEVFDMDPDNMTYDYINEVLINGQTDFDTTQSFPYDAEVLVICHHSYEKYSVKIYVNCVNNLIFSRYDIDFYIDEERVQQLEHGQKAEYEFGLKAGEHTFTFTKRDTTNVKGTEKIDVFSDMEISYKLFCTSDEVNIETVYIDRKIDLDDNEIKLDISASDLKYKNYREVINILETAGFTNIKTDVLYDIFWGFTSEGELETVTIDGRSEFKKGEVFTKDAEIIVTYHMPEEDDPNRISEEQNSEVGGETQEGSREEPSESEEQESVESGDESQSETSAEADEILTAGNCEELAELLNHRRVHSPMLAS